MVRVLLLLRFALTMSQASPSTTGSPHAQLPTSKISPPTASTDWLAGLIVGARSAAAAGEFAPFPGIKGAAGAVVSLLETIDVSRRASFLQCHSADRKPMIRKTAATKTI